MADAPLTVDPPLSENWFNCSGSGGSGEGTHITHEVGDAQARCRASSRLRARSALTAESQYTHG